MGQGKQWTSVLHRCQPLGPGGRRSVVGGELCGGGCGWIGGGTRSQWEEGDENDAQWDSVREVPYFLE